MCWSDLFAHGVAEHSRVGDETSVRASIAKIAMSQSAGFGETWSLSKARLQPAR